MSGAHSHTAAARLLAEYFTVDLFDWSREQDPGFAGWPACTCGHQFDEHNNFDPGGLRGDYPCEHGQIVDGDGIVVGGGCEQHCADYEPSCCPDCGEQPRHRRTEVSGCRNEFHYCYDTFIGYEI
jgi:hypothetical protein